MSRRAIRVQTILGLTALLSLTLATVAHAGDASAPGSVATTKEEQAVLNYWTPKRLAAARPAPAPTTANGPSAAPPPSLAAPQSAPPTEPVNLLSAKDDYYIGNPSSFPARVDGALYATAHNGQQFSCTASVITASGRSLIMTAGHCVYNASEGGWAHNWIFIPAYDRGSKPYGTWVGNDAYAPNGWIANSNDGFAFDVAAIPLLPNGAGQRIQDAIGAWGYTFGSNPNQYHQVIGYPGKPSPPYDGERMVGCDTNFAFFEAPYTTSTDGPMAVQPCYQTHGASGGPYVTSDGHVQAVDSHGYCEVNATYCGYVFGTYFGAVAQTLYNTAAPIAPSLPAAATPGPAGPAGRPSWCPGLLRKLRHKRLPRKKRRRLTRTYRSQCL